ncbi:MAG: hypothetical protein CVT83_06585 [Alphaproteobacteria bacterium HGW-Alphaproteobacteria-5]|nr:MAG: hypothetical protein CVT83_06585 [Alphaproteobacteria bacterium HGW-Alphaproteobacteria-5]
MEIAEAFMRDVAAGPAWVEAWVNFMGIVFFLAIPFAFSRAEARWALVVMALSLPAMMWLYATVGFVRLLGIVHVVLWTPFAIYLWRQRSTWRVRETLAGKWTALLFATVLVSLVFDYLDVIRYMLGDID